MNTLGRVIQGVLYYVAFLLFLFLAILFGENGMWAMAAFAVFTAYVALTGLVILIRDWPRG